MAREKVEEASSGCILVTCGTFSFICGIIGLFRIWILTFLLEVLTRTDFDSRFRIAKILGCLFDLIKVL